MTSALNKRQQARNERALQELIRTVSGNDRCADCQARNPGRRISFKLCCMGGDDLLIVTRRMGELECTFTLFPIPHLAKLIWEDLLCYKLGILIDSFWMQLGIFLCMRCATIHRKLGTHISKVKSLSMDSWSNDQVEVMGYTRSSEVTSC